MNEWISVEDAVPSRYVEHVFIFVQDSGEVYLSKVETYSGTEYPKFCDREGVTHWKYIEFPEPPKDE